MPKIICPKDNANNATRKEVITMGGKPNPGTPRDKRLSANKPKMPKPAPKAPKPMPKKGK